MTEMLGKIDVSDWEFELHDISMPLREALDSLFLKVLKDAVVEAIENSLRDTPPEVIFPTYDAADEVRPMTIIVRLDAFGSGDFIGEERSPEFLFDLEKILFDDIELINRDETDGTLDKDGVEKYQAVRDAMRRIADRIDRVLKEAGK